MTPVAAKSDPLVEQRSDGLKPVAGHRERFFTKLDVVRDIHRDDRVPISDDLVYKGIIASEKDVYSWIGERMNLHSIKSIDGEGKIWPYMPENVEDSIMTDLLSLLPKNLSISKYQYTPLYEPSKKKMWLMAMENCAPSGTTHVMDFKLGALTYSPYYQDMTSKIIKSTVRKSPIYGFFLAGSNVEGGDVKNTTSAIEFNDAFYHDLIVNFINATSPDDTTMVVKAILQNLSRFSMFFKAQKSFAFSGASLLFVNRGKDSTVTLIDLAHVHGICHHQPCNETTLEVFNEAQNEFRKLPFLDGDDAPYSGVDAVIDGHNGELKGVLVLRRLFSRIIEQQGLDGVQCLGYLGHDDYRREATEATYRNR